MDSSENLIAVAVVLLIYFAPALVANARHHKNTGAIAALNLLIGWTGLGWVLALVWSLTN